MSRALLAGATGLIGQKLLPLLLDSPYYQEVKVVTRRPLGMEHDKLTVIEMDFDDLANRVDDLSADDVFCCLGTTQKTEGGGAVGREGMLKVDKHYVIELAAALQHSAQQFLVVSAMAANAQSSIFYNRVKGEMEEGLRALNYAGLHIFRPSLLLGDRAAARPQDKRVGEAIWQKTMPMFNAVMAGKFSRYRPTPIDRIAQEMLNIALAAPSGQQVYHFYTNHTGE